MQLFGYFSVEIVEHEGIDAACRENKKDLLHRICILQSVPEIAHLLNSMFIFLNTNVKQNIKHLNLMLHRLSTRHT